MQVINTYHDLEHLYPEFVSDYNTENGKKTTIFDTIKKVRSSGMFVFKGQNKFYSCTLAFDYETEEYASYILIVNGVAKRNSIVIPNALKVEKVTYKTKAMNEFC